MLVVFFLQFQSKLKSFNLSGSENYNFIFLAERVREFWVSASSRSISMGRSTNPARGFAGLLRARLPYGLIRVVRRPLADMACASSVWGGTSYRGSSPGPRVLTGPRLEGSKPRNGARDRTSASRGLPSTHGGRPIPNPKYIPFPAWRGTGIRCGAGARASPPHLSFH